MTERALLTLLFVAALGCGLVSGIFFAFSSFVMKALARLRPEQGIAAMQTINVVVINPVFFAAFFGTAVVCLLLAVWTLLMGLGPRSVWVLAGSLFYLIGTIGVTMACNVPWNNALASVDPASPGGAGVWAGYVTGWTAWNHVRTVAALAAALAFTVAICLSR